MTVQELIDKLKKLDPSAHVFTEGYEGGYCDVDIEPEVFMYLNANRPGPSYYGPHDIGESNGGSLEGKRMVRGYVL